MNIKKRKLPRLDQVAVERRFMTKSEHSEMLGWAEGQFAGGHLKSNPAGPNRYFNRYSEDDSVPNTFWQIRQRAISIFSVTEYEDEPKYRCFLGCNTTGGFVKLHTDPSPPDKHHIRMNIMLSKPEGGGHPIVNGKQIDIEERDMWCFFPEFMAHESSPVLGVRKRFVLSIGILVPLNSLNL